MDNKAIFKHVDHSLLKPDASLMDIELAAREATVYHAASLCIAPSYVSTVALRFPGLTICTVVGFPFGYSTTGVKVFEAQQAIASGAKEIDMCINQCEVKNRRFHRVMAEIVAIKSAIGDNILKVLVETCLLNEEEKRELCNLINASGADYIKTSSGYGSAGAALEDIELFRSLLEKHVRIKASGGIRTKKQMEDFLAAGADRLGCSGAAKVLFKKVDLGPASPPPTARAYNQPGHPMPSLLAKLEHQAQEEAPAALAEQPEQPEQPVKAPAKKRGPKKAEKPVAAEKPAQAPAKKRGPKKGAE